MIVGLDDIPDDEEPPVNVVHLAFQTMVAAGTTMAGIAAWWLWRRRRHGDRALDSPWFLRAAVAGGGLAVLALEAGWTTTEVGRQPSIVYRVMRVEDAVTTNSGIWISLVAMVIITPAWASSPAGCCSAWPAAGATTWTATSPRRTARAASWSRRAPAGRREATREPRRSRCRVDVLGVVAYAILGGADFGSGVWTSWPATPARVPTCARR